MRGLILLEVMVALVVLSLVGLGALELTHMSHQVVDNARTWSEAVAYAEDGMELAKMGSTTLRGPPGEVLPGGFHRQITRRPAAVKGFETVTVSVILPGGARFDLDRLARIDRNGGERW